MIALRKSTLCSGGALYCTTTKQTTKQLLSSVPFLVESPIQQWHQKLLSFLPFYSVICSSSLKQVSSCICLYGAGTIIAYTFYQKTHTQVFPIYVTISPRWKKNTSRQFYILIARIILAARHPDPYSDIHCVLLPCLQISIHQLGLLG